MPSLMTKPQFRNLQQTLANIILIINNIKSSNTYLDQNLNIKDKRWINLTPKNLPRIWAQAPERTLLSTSSASSQTCLGITAPVKSITNFPSCKQLPVAVATSSSSWYHSQPSSPLNRSQWVSQWVSELVTDKHCQWSDSGPTII